ncbi:MAG TPA: carboxypeptidase regulatory-like domain-containing protein [Candidatus Polarisedimenticolia bacterium]|nr:carboxypeptidase regulatory-like domain-containing protein [Candidatus Polarisedimenticolia bacterium]
MPISPAGRKEATPRHGSARTAPAATMSLVALAAVILFGSLACGGGGQAPASSSGASSPAGGDSKGAPAAPPGAIADGTAIGTGAVSGKATFTGTPPPRKKISMTAEAACHKPGSGEALSDDLIVDAGGALRNVWVRVVSGLEGKAFAPPSAQVELDQAGCLFSPHVLLARAGQSIMFRNSDATLHNINALAKVNRGFNLSLPNAGMSVTRNFAKPEAVRLKCDVHAWMSAWIVVNDTPFQALTGEGGTFAIDGLPAGTYGIEAWHERLGTSRQEVTLADGERKEIAFAFSAPAR